MARLLPLLLAATGPFSTVLAQEQPPQAQRLRAPTFESTAGLTPAEEAAPIKKAAGPATVPEVAVLPLPKQETPDYPPPSSLYYQQRVEYTFPEPVALAAAKLEGNRWTKAYAAFPCLNCFVTDAGCYYELSQNRNLQIAFLTGTEYLALLTSCPTPQLATKECWTAAGLEGVKIQDYAYRTYAYKDPGATPVPDGTYLVLNNDPNGAAEIEYGMAYFGLDPTAPSFPEGKVIDAKEDPRAATRLKEGLLKPVLLPKQEQGIKAGKARPPQDPRQEGGGVPASLPPHVASPAGAAGMASSSSAAAGPNDTGVKDAADMGGEWTRRALAMGNTYANNGFNWWSNAGAEYKGSRLLGVFLSGDLYRTLTDACPETEDGVLVLTTECWAKAGLDSNPATQPQPLASGARLTRTYDGAADPNKGGACVDGWWLFINASDNDVTITKADANFGLRTLGDNPRDSAPPRFI